MDTHDSSYRLIFSHPEIIEELLRDFVPEEWVQRIDFGTLEKLNASYVSDDLRDRAGDVIWRVKAQDSWLYIYLLIEFQSRNDRWMALRLLVYIGLLHQDLIKSGRIQPGGLLPPVFPIVVYNGERRWTARQEFSELVEPARGGLQAYCPSLRYFLLDEGRVPAAELVHSEGTLADIIRLESSPEPLAVRQIVGRLSKRLREPRYDSLRRTLTVWISRVVLRQMVPGEEIPELSELQEIDNMLAERVARWTEQWKREGLEAGRLEGIREGRKEGLQKGFEQGSQRAAYSILAQLIQKRFGPIPSWAEERMRKASAEELQQWAENILDAPDLDNLFS